MYPYIFLAILPVTCLAGQVGQGLAVDKRQISISIGLPTETGSNGSNSSTQTSSDSSSPTTESESSTTTSSSSTTSSSPSVTTTATTSSRGPTTTTAPSPTSEQEQPSSTSVSQEVVTFVTTVDGATITGTRTTNVPNSSTSSGRPTGSALSSDGDGNSAGLSESSKKIIGGVVGGVGGALLVGALAFTAWRIWGKKKPLHDDDFYDPNRNEEKLSSSTENTPFRSTLDQYHQPSPSNTASNF